METPALSHSGGNSMLLAISAVLSLGSSNMPRRLGDSIDELGIRVEKAPAQTRNPPTNTNNAPEAMTNVDLLVSLKLLRINSTLSSVNASSQVPDKTSINPAEAVINQRFTTSLGRDLVIGLLFVNAGWPSSFIVLG